MVALGHGLDIANECQSCHAHLGQLPRNTVNNSVSNAPPKGNLFFWLKQ